MWLYLSQQSLYISLLSIAFNPTAWNVVARNEYHNKTLTRILGGNSQNACYFLAFLIFVFGLFRDSLYHNALLSQPKYELFPSGISRMLAAVIFLSGQVLVLSSTYRLGITGTFLGDYFGILMNNRVEGFPFSILENPMYVGSSLCFLASAFWYERPAGIIISAYVHLCYQVALQFEGPFTSMIYSTRAKSNMNTTSNGKKEL